MADSVEVKLIARSEKHLLEKQLLEYLVEIGYDKVNDHIIDYPYLDLYWVEKNRFPFKILKNSEWVGFALVNSWIVCRDFNATKSIAEFYIMPNHRRSNIGKEAAYQLFDRFREKWEIKQDIDKLAARNFWRTIIAEYSKNDFLEVEIGKEGSIETVQLFNSEKGR